MGLMERVKQRAPAGILNSEVLLRDQFVEQVLNSFLLHELKQLVRRQPNSTLLDIRAEAIQWEREGSSGGARDCSHSVPLMCSVQYGVHGGPQASVPSPSMTEMSEMKEMLKRQQEQLSQLTESIARLQNPQQYNRPPCTGPIMCLRCNQPGHIAQHCDGVRVPSCSQVPLRPPSTPGRQSYTTPVPEN